MQLFNKILIYCIIIFSVAYTDELTFDMYMKKAISADINLDEAKFQYEELRSKNNQWFAEYIPSLSYGINSTRSKQGPREVFVGSIPFTQPATSYEYHSSSISLSHQIFDFGNSFRKKKILSLDAEKIKYDYLQKAHIHTEQAITIFFQLAKAEEILELYKENLKEIQHQQIYLNEAVENGVRSHIDKLRMEVTLNDVLSDINTQKIEISQQQADLLLIINEPFNTKYTLIVDKGTNPNTITEISFSSPAIDYLSNLLEINKLELSIIKWDFFPDIYFNAGYSRGSSYFDALYSDFDKDWNIYYALNFSFPLLKNQKRNLEKAQKEIAVNRVKRQIDNENWKSNKQVTLLIKQIQIVVEQIELQKINVSNYNKIYNYELERFCSGLIDYNILKEAYNNYFYAKQSLISLEYKCLDNKEKLELMSGKWDDDLLKILFSKN